MLQRNIHESDLVSDAGEIKWYNRIIDMRHAHGSKWLKHNDSVS